MENWREEGEADRDNYGKERAGGLINEQSTLKRAG